VSEGVAEGAVREEKIVDSGLRKNVSEFGARPILGSGRGGAEGRAELAAEFKSLKECAPCGVHTRGICFPSFVQFFQKSGVAWVSDTTEGRGWRGGGTIRI
jgi:hypothetical protein